MVDAVVLKPLSYPNPGRLVMISQPYQNDQSGGLDYPDYVDILATQRSFDSLAVAGHDYSLDLSGSG